MSKRHNTAGFTLTEMLVVVAIISILFAASLPFFGAQSRKAYRSEALEIINTNAQALERHYTENNTYVGYTPTSITGENYNFAISNLTASTYTITATAQGTQANDEQNGTSCTTLSLTQAGVNSPSDCWK
ncbi:MAG: type IV pilin protein [Gammaproteobacteria bacterium]